MIAPDPRPPIRLGNLILGDPNSRLQLEASATAIYGSIARFVDHTFGGPEKMQVALRRMVQNIARLVEALPQVEQRVAAAEKSVFERLIDYEWFFDPEMGADTFFQLAERVDVHDEDGINRIMVENFRGRLRAIASELATNHPARGRLLADAFSAHAERRYGLAIPVFLSQADGISCELLGAEYFTFMKSKGLTETLIAQMAGVCFLESALRALIPKGAMREHTSQARAGRLNRHAVLHGADTGYDSELNSLKAISLLNFMSRMNMLKQKHLAASGGV